MSDLNITKREELAPNLFRAWLYNRRVVLYEVGDARRETIDIWVNDVIALSQTWDTKQPYYAIYDVSRILTLTPYARHRTQEAARAYFNHHGAYAVVMSKSLVSNVIRFFVEREMNRGNQNIVRQVFTDFELAQAWIQSFLEEQAG